MQAHDPRFAVEGAKHHADAAVLLHVRHGRDAAPGDVEVVKVWSLSTRKVPIVPLGERLTKPSPAMGAVATKKTGWASSHTALDASMLSNTVAMNCSIRRAARVFERMPQ